MEHGNKNPTRFYLSKADVFTDNIEIALNIYLHVLADERGSIGNPLGSTQYYGIFCALVATQEDVFML